MNPGLRRLIPLVLLLLFALPVEAEERFRGWEGVRVVKEEGQAERMRRLDAGANRRDRLVVVNRRQARLEIYRWLPPEDRADGPKSEGNDAPPNALPMAPELKRRTLTFEQLPRDAAATDLDGDGAEELLVLTSSPKELVSYGRQLADDQAESSQPAWERQHTWDLLDGSFAGRARLLLIRSRGGDRAAEAYISFESGIQRLVLKPEARAAWLKPKAGSRDDWWLADLDGDGDRDVITFRKGAERSVRWYEAAGDGLRPPQVLHDQSAKQAMALPTADGAELMLLADQPAGVIRRYALDRSEASPLGRRQALSLPGGANIAWTGVRVDGEKSLVATDPKRPELTLYRLSDDGWSAGPSFPAVSDVQGIVAPQAEPGTLLIWAEGGGDLHRSRWKDGRFTYPKPHAFEAEGDDRKVIALGTVGQTAWWAQRVGKAVDLYVWPPEREQPRRTRFKGVGAKTNKALWLGGQRLLVQDQYARHPKRVRMIEGAAQTNQPSHLKRTSFQQYRLYKVDGQLQPARIHDGVLRWLDSSLHATDQIMLEGGADLISYVPLGGSKAWALERGGRFAQLLEPDQTGIPRMSRRVELPGGQRLRRDPVLGLILVNDAGVVRLRRGRSAALRLRESFERGEEAASTKQKKTTHRLFATDVTGDGRRELLLCDDRRHELTAVRWKTKEGRDEQQLQRLLTWKVFEDRGYPYGGGSQQEGLVTEPRAIQGLDLDGDGHQDLALLSHDRLLIYLGREQEG